MLKPKIKVELFSCYRRTYRPHIKNILKYLYGGTYNLSDVEVNVINTESAKNKNIQAQRRVTDKSVYKGRIINIYENNILKHIVGLSNTNFDKDREYEFNKGKSNKAVSTYGKDGYHANTYLKQGINQIFDYYFQNKSTADLSFYLLDIKETYPHNLYNCLSYRELETIGFKVLNIDMVNFDEYKSKCHTSTLNKNNLKFASFNKYLNDIAYISGRNSGNVPSYLQCDEVETVNEEGEHLYMTEKYTYTFKVLSAQQYDSLLRCWCLKKLADDENTDIEFKIGKQYFAFDLDNRKIADKLSAPVENVFKLADIDFKYTTSADFMNEVLKSDNTYMRYKNKNEIRNQVLFRNNIRKKGIPTVCEICGEDDVKTLDAAHLWEVHDIQDAPQREINSFIKANNLNDLIKMASEEYHNELFFKRYYLANSGDNGVWLCKQHHKQFDLNYYCFDSGNGTILLKFDNSKTLAKFKADMGQKEAVSSEVMTELTKAYMKKRQIKFMLL